MPATNFTIETLWRELEFKPTPNQRDAILHIDGPLYLPAGPGSGKTRVLLWRTLNLIVFRGVSPDEIYLSTFTEKAAHQLKEGLRSLLALATSKTGKPYDLGRMYVGTIHSLCQKLLTDRRFSSNRERRQRPVLMDQLSQYFYVARSQRWGELVGGLGFGEGPEEIHQTINRFLTSAKPGNGSVSKFRAVSNSISLFNRLSEEDFQTPSCLPLKGEVSLPASQAETVGVPYCLTCPSPMMTHLYVVSSRSAIGPRACRR